LHRKQLLPVARTARGSARPDRLGHSGQAAAPQRTTRTFGKYLGLVQGTSVHVSLSSSRVAWCHHTPCQFPKTWSTHASRTVQPNPTPPRSTSITTPVLSTFRNTTG